MPFMATRGSLPAQNNCQPPRSKEHPTSTVQVKPLNLPTLDKTSTPKKETMAKNSVNLISASSPVTFFNQIVRLTENSNTACDLERRQKRAQKFGVSVILSEDEKRKARLARFGGTIPSETKSSEPKKLEQVAEEKKRKARAERFGLVTNSAYDEEGRKKARAVRFGLVSEEEKRKARASRFGLQSLNNTSSEANKTSKTGTGTMT